MQKPTDLTDREALARNRRRARSLREPALFLQEEAATEIQERLTLVNRAFKSPLIVTAWPEIWQNRFPGARIIADTDTLEATPGAHDLVIHAMTLHWANDPVGQLVQCRRALRPDGLFLGALFGGRTLSELRAVLAEAEVAISGGLSPRVAPMAEIRDLGALLQRAGFALPVVDAQTYTVSYASAFGLMHDLRAMGEGNAMAARRRLPSGRGLFDDTARRYGAAFSQPDGRISASFEIIFLAGWAPDSSQQQPLRPGSATERLANVLGVGETRVPDRD